MKQLLLITLTLTMSFNLFGQTNSDTIYVVFTSGPLSEPGVYCGKVALDPAKDRDQFRSYVFVDLAKQYLCDFIYSNRKKNPENPIITKPLSFLDTIEYIDWDAIHPSLTQKQAYTKFEEIKSHKKIYFIDRNEIASDSIKLVPVTYPQTTF